VASVAADRPDQEVSSDPVGARRSIGEVTVFRRCDRLGPASRERQNARRPVLIRRD
jgi:hypothetical protein